MNAGPSCWQHLLQSLICNYTFPSSCLSIFNNQAASLLWQPLKPLIASCLNLALSEAGTTLGLSIKPISRVWGQYKAGASGTRGRNTVAGGSWMALPGKAGWALAPAGATSAPCHVRLCLCMPLCAGEKERGKMSVGSSLTHIRAGREGRKGDSAWAVSQQERWVYPVWLGPQEPVAVHVGA